MGGEEENEMKKIDAEEFSLEEEGVIKSN